MVAINFFDSSYTDLFSPLEYGQIAPLGWLWLEKLMFDLGGGSVLLMRLPAFIAGSVSVVLFWQVAQRFVEQRSALFALAVFCASYYPMRYSIEVKPYAFDLLVALLLIKSAINLSPKHFFATAVIGIFFSLPSMFVAAGCGLYLFYKLPQRRLLLIACGIVLLSNYFWMAINFASPHAEAASWLREMDMWVTSFPPLTEWWKIPAWLLERHAGYMSAYPTGGRNFGSSITLVLQVIGVVVMLRQSQKQNLWILWSSLPFLFLAAALQKYPYGGSVRVAIFLAPAICICAGVGLNKIFSHRNSLHVFASTMLIMILGGMFNDISKPYKTPSDLLFKQAVASFSLTVDSNATLLGHLPDDAAGSQVNLHDYGGGLARLRFLLQREFGADADWTYSISDDILKPQSVVINYNGPDKAPTLR